jgi:xylose isomerase
MPYWCVANPVGDPFGPGVMEKISSLKVTDILCRAKRDGLIEFTAAHDDDLVNWDPYHENDDADVNSETYQTLKKIKDKLAKAKLSFKMITCDLHGNPVFRNGGISNPDPRVRILAAKKVMRALRIGNFLGAEYFTYWVARDGFETQFAVPWGRNYKYIMDGLNLVTRYSRDKKLSIKKGTIENKPNEPRGEMFLPTVGHSLALIAQLESPDFWGVNPELLQHEQMTGLTGVQAACFAASQNKLFFLHVGNQKPNQFDNDNPVLIGIDGLKEFISILYALNKMGWDGYIEYDNHMLRTDTAVGEENAVILRRRFLELDVASYRMAEQKANQLAADKDISKIQEKLWNSHIDLAKVLENGDFEKMAALKIDYDAVNREALGIGDLDMLVNKKLLGL